MGFELRNKIREYWLKSYFIVGVLLIISNVSYSQDFVMYFVPNIYNGIDTSKAIGDRNVKNKTISVKTDPNQSNFLIVRIVDNDKHLIGEGKYKLAQTDTVYRIVEELQGERYKKVKWVNLIYKREGYWSQMKKGKVVSNYYSDGEKLRVKDD